MRSFAAVLGVSVLAAASLVAGALASGGSRSHPIALHTLVKLPAANGWYARVNATVPNGTAAVLHENMFNDRPVAGRQFYLINITMSYRGKGSSDLLTAGSFSALGRSNVAYSDDGGTDSCGVTPHELDTFKTVFSGGAISGNLCFSVRRTDVASLELYFEPEFSLNNTKLFFALR